MLEPDRQTTPIEHFQQAILTLASVSPTNEQVQHCNRLVIESLKREQNFDVLLQLLITSSENETACSLIISFVAFYVRTQVRPGVGVVRHDKTRIYEKIKALFFCATVREKHKRMLRASFSEFLATLSPEFMKMRRLLCEQIVKLFHEAKQPTVQQLGDVLHLIEAVITPNLETENLRLLEQTLLVNFLKLSLKQLRVLDQLLAGQSTVTVLEQSTKIFWTQKIIAITSLLFTRATTTKLAYLKNSVIISSQLARISEIGLKLSQNRMVFVMSPGSIDSYEAINQIKLHIIDMLTDSVKTLSKSRSALNDPKYIPIVQALKAIIKDIVPMIAQEMSGYPKKKLTAQKNYRQVLVLTSKIVSLPVLLPEVTSIRDMALFKICLPCFISSDEDRQLSAEDFCNKREKNVDPDNILYIVQAATGIIEAYIDNVYGSIPYLVSSLINLMDFQLTADPRYFQQLPEALSSSEFFKNFTHYEQIEASLSIFSVLSYQADNRDDISIALQEFIVRRQQFFSRIDVPPEVITAFLGCCAYYLSNFYQLILNGKADRDFHRSLLTHALELLNASYNQTKKQYINNQMAKIGIQALDYISNTVIQQHLFSAIFPAFNPESTNQLVHFFMQVFKYFDSSFNHTIMQSVVIDFYEACMGRHYNEETKLATLPEPVKNQLPEVTVVKIMNSFVQGMKNQTIAKQKMLEIYAHCVRVSSAPVMMVQAGAQLFNHIVENEYAFLDEALEIFQVLCHRAVAEKLPLTQKVSNITVKLTTKAMKVVDNEKFENNIFDLVLNINLLAIGQEQIAATLLEVFEQRLEQKDTDEEAQIIMEKALYLLMQISFSNFALVSSKFWQSALSRMIDYMRVNYVMQDTITIGKATCICLGCYIQNPQGVQVFLQNRVQGLWDCIVDDVLKYSTVTQKKITCNLLLRLLTEHSDRVIIKDKFPDILKSVCVIMYYLYEKSEISWGHDDDDSMNSSADNQSEKQDQKPKPWKHKFNLMKQNPFLSTLPDQRHMLKNICVALNQNNHAQFQKFIENLPIGIQNLVKNKIMMYRNDTAAAHKTKMRTIYKVKRMEEEED